MNQGYDLTKESWKIRVKEAPTIIFDRYHFYNVNTKVYDAWNTGAGNGALKVVNDKTGAVTYYYFSTVIDIVGAGTNTCGFQIDQCSPVFISTTKGKVNPLEVGKDYSASWVPMENVP